MDFSNGPLVKAPYFHCRGTGLVPGWGSKIPHATWHKTNNNETKKKSRNKREKTSLRSLVVKRGKRGDYGVDCGTQER